MACRPHSTSVVSNQSAISDSGMYTESEHSDSEYHRASVAIASLPSDTTTINPQNCIHTTNTSNNQRLQIYHHQNNNINNYYQSPYMQLQQMQQSTSLRQINNINLPPPPPRLNNHSSTPLKYKSKHKLTLSCPNIELNGHDYYSLSSKKKKKRMSDFSCNLLNTARSISSYKSRAITKIKNKNNKIYKDCINIKYSKSNLESFNKMNDILSISQKLYFMQLKHIESMKQFSSTIHSTIDLGRNRTNYLGKYLKMIASTMHSIQQIYGEYTSNLNEYLIEPLKITFESPNIQLCKNYRYEYSKIKHAYNSNPTSENKLELENIEEKFINITNTLIKERDKSLRFPMDNFQQCFYKFAEKQAKYICDKRVIDGYDKRVIDEFKINKNKIENKILIQNLIKEMTYIIFCNSNKEFNKYINKCKQNVYDNKYSILLFHRDKFPPSMRFLTDIFAPLADKYYNNSNIEFINIHYKCTDILDKYNVNSFPTCLVFINGIISNYYKPITGNGDIQRNELESIVKEIIQKINKLKPIVKDIISMNNHSFIQISQ